MKLHWRKLLKQLDYKPGETILDVGGGMDPVPIADMVIDCADFGRGGKAYTILDLCTNTFPFPDNHFDICICSQTLEDLASPNLAILEMSRVAKRGIIEVPHRGPESLKNKHYNSKRFDFSMDEVWHFGTGHHKWLFEEQEGILTLVPKIQFLLMRYPIPSWQGQGGINFQWKDQINYALMYDIDENAIEYNYATFRETSKGYWE
jgi:ubiquinone/menaquinone biosynthesis C-methylase UbiE